MKMPSRKPDKLPGDTHSKLKWKLTALSGVFTTGFIVLLES